jgi:GT2 family glycosyltransferase
VTAGPATDGLTTSLILLTFNRWDRTRALLDSMVADRDDYRGVELVWIDNGSQDETVEAFESWLRSHSAVFGRVVRRHNAANHGFVIGVNEGICLAGAPEVCLINSDAVVSDGWLSRLRSRLAADVAAVGPVSDGMPWNQSLRHRATGPRDVPVVYGFCLLTRTAVMDRVGLLDERYGRGVIEVEDWCERAARLGLRFVVDTDVFVGHDEPHASYTPRVNAMLHVRNKRLFQRKWGVGPHLWGDRTAPEQEFGRTDVHVLDDPDAPQWLPSLLEAARADAEQLLVLPHGEDDHVAWIGAARRDPRLNVVCVRPDWTPDRLADLVRANARRAK